MKKAGNFNEAQKPNLRLGAVISRLLLTTKFKIE